VTSAVDIANLRARFPRAFGLSVLTRTLHVVGAVLFVAWLVALCIWFDITPARLSRGISGLLVILRQMVPPSPGMRWRFSARSSPRRSPCRWASWARATWW
jgi:hypothetical protein